MYIFSEIGWTACDKNGTRVCTGILGVVATSSKGDPHIHRGVLGVAITSKGDLHIPKVAAMRVIKEGLKS